MFRLVGWLVDWLVGMLVGCFFEVIGLSIGVDLRFYVHIYGTVGFLVSYCTDSVPVIVLSRSRIQKFNG